MILSVHIQQHGFTLLELVLVLFILAILTTTSLSFIENEDGQLRYDESLNKLDLITSSLLRERVHQNSSFYSGFVTDNGAIPPNNDLEPLTSSTTSWSDVSGNEWLGYGTITPYYYNPDGAGSEVELNDTNNPEYNLFKGFRGSYLLIGLDADGAFLDGWGEAFTIASASNDFDYTFVGTSKPAPFNTDVSRSLAEADWTVAPTALNISIENNTGASIGADAYEVVVAVFENAAVDTATDPEDRWVSFHFTQDTAIADGDIFSSAGGSWEVNGTAVNTERIPVGEHIALLVDTSITGTDINGLDEIVDSNRFTVFANVSSQPEVTLSVP